MLIVTAVLISIPGLYMNISAGSFSHPAAAVMIHAVKNHEIEQMAPEPLADLLGLHNSKADIPDEINAVIEASSQKSGSHKTDSAVSGDDVAANGEGEETIDPDETGSGVGETDEEDSEEEGSYDEDEDEDEDDEEEEDTYPKEFTTVDDDYFTDAVFLGDSRVQGLGLYSDLPAVNYGVVSMQLYKVFERKAISTELGKLTMDPPYGKVYLKFGLNELGWGNNGLFEEYYYTLIDYIKAVEPDAVIYVMSVIHVTAAEQASSSVFNNDAIDKRNEVLKEIAENEHVYYLDLNEVFTGEDGCLPAEDSFDGIHIRSQAMYKWVDYLKTHAIE